MKKLLLYLVFIAQIAFAENYYYIRDNSRIPSYDTTYIEGQDTFRQIYICDKNAKTETYILIKNGTTILKDTEKWQ